MTKTRLALAAAPVALLVAVLLVVTLPPGHGHEPETTRSVPEARALSDSGLRPSGLEKRERSASRPPTRAETRTAHGDNDGRALLSGNPILVVANAGYTNASEERESLLEALRRSGEPSGEWVRAAAQRIDDIRTFVEDKSLGEAAEVGCWAAGCGVKITFKDTHSTSRLELLADPVNHGAWRPGVVITSPADDSDGRPSSYLFLVAPSDPRSR